MIDGQRVELLVDCVLQQQPEQLRRSVVETLRLHLKDMGGPEHLVGGILAAGESSHVVGYAMHYAGRLAMLSGPRIIGQADRGSEAVTTLANLLCEAALSRWQPELIQTTLAAGEPDGPLRAARFRPLADLHQMRLDLKSSAAAELSAAASGRWRIYDEPQREAYLRWLDSTYLGTLDCPELNSLRGTAAAIEGYLMAARGGLARHHAPAAAQLPQWWALYDTPPGGAETAGEIIAACLMTPVSPEAWELSYVGVAQGHRRCGYGRQAVRFAVDRLRQLNAAEAIIYVDVRNTPAIAMYEKLGFERTETYSVYYRRG